MIIYYALNFVNQKHIVNYFAVIVEINEMKWKVNRPKIYVCQYML